MKWYGHFLKVSQKLEQTEMFEESDLTKEVPISEIQLSKIVTVIAVMLMNEEIDRERIESELKKLKRLKDKGLVKSKVGFEIVKKFDVALNNPYSIWKDLPSDIKEEKKKRAFNVLTEVMTGLV